MSEIKSEYDLRNAILRALNEVYAPVLAHKDWYGCKFEVSYVLDMNLQLVTDILAVFAFAHIDPENNKRMAYYGDTMYRMIVNVIWNVHSGGSTAEIAAQKVCAILNVPVED